MKKNKDLQEERRQIVREHRKTEAQLVEQGKTPYFLKRGMSFIYCLRGTRLLILHPSALIGDIKKLELAKQFEEYKKRAGADADLDRFIEKKRRRKASKQKKYIPRLSTVDEQPSK